MREYGLPSPVSPSSKPPSQQGPARKKEKGLMELHYESMRKACQERAASTGAELNRGPSMHRPFTALAGYGGFVPGKNSSNFHSCSFKRCSDLAYDLRGRTMQPMS